MPIYYKYFIFFAIFLMFPLFVSAKSLQTIIDNAPDGSAVILSEGMYEGDILINKSVSIIGSGDNVIIHGSGKGSVIKITGTDVTVKNIAVRRSGGNHDNLDSCIFVKETYNVSIIGNRLSDCLFGVRFDGVSRSLVEGNSIISSLDSTAWMKANEVQLEFTLPIIGLVPKGDGIFFWESNRNIVRSNKVDNVRDVVFWYSSYNRIEHNTIRNSRYGVHFMYSDNNAVLGNITEGNNFGIFMMYSNNGRIGGNKSLQGAGVENVGLGFKAASNAAAVDNIIMYNARGLYLDESPNEIDSPNIFSKNRILYNTTGILLHGYQFGSVFMSNEFTGNLDDIAIETKTDSIALNTWSGNYWDIYEGFDRDKNGYGDVPHESIIYSGGIMNRNPFSKFFYGAPIMGIYDFILRLLPSSVPETLAYDVNPKIQKKDFRFSIKDVRADVNVQKQTHVTAGVIRVLNGYTVPYRSAVKFETGDIGTRYNQFIMKRRSKEYIIKCSSCHGAYGEGSIAPSLSKSAAPDVINKLMEFKSDAVNNSLMRELLIDMSYSDVFFIAEDIGAFNRERSQNLEK